jgi:FtsP/CotA-like multicopper oxidase with cupredoxin domain
MSGEGSRSTRFAPRNARWAHNHQVTWLADGGAPEDFAAFRQQSSPVPPPYGNGNGHNGNGHNGNGNGNGHNGNGHGKKLSVTISEGERERLKAEVVYWGLQQAQQGRMLSEEQLQAEFDRRVRSAELLLGDLEVDLQHEYDRVRAAEQMLRDREEWQQQARFAQAEPRPTFRDSRPTFQEPHQGYQEPRPTFRDSRPHFEEARRTFQAEPMAQPEPPSKPSKGWMPPKPGVSRRGALKLIGLLGLQGAAAAATIKVMDQRANDAAQAAANSGVPAGVLAAGGANAVDGSADTDPLQVNQPVLAANFNKGASLYAPFPGALTNPDPARLALLRPPPALPAQAGRVRQFNLKVTEQVIDIAKGVKWFGWMYNGTIPGPVIRVTQGDTVHVTLDNSAATHPHSVHFHSVHAGPQDGVFQIIPAGGKGTYSFTAEPFGVFPYHCHIAPFDQHVARGLYGTLIIDPPTPRPAANEMVMLLNGFDLQFSKNNDVYSVNGLPGYYQDHPIPLKIGQLNRVYIVNMTEFDAVNSFHLHGNLFNYIPSGTSLKPSFLNDVVHLGIADRGIAEFSYKLPGQFLFHAHQTELSMKGWSGIFNVT